jgi:hypothetical protein
MRLILTIPHLELQAQVRYHILKPTLAELAIQLMALQRIMSKPINVFSLPLAPSRKSESKHQTRATSNLHYMMTTAVVVNLAPN